MAFLGLYFYFFDVLMNIPVSLGGAFMAVSCVQFYLEKSPLSKSWNRGFLIFAVLLYAYYLLSPFLNYKEIFGFDFGFCLLLVSFLYSGLFILLSYLAKKKTAEVKTEDSIWFFLFEEINLLTFLLTIMICHDRFNRLHFRWLLTFLNFRQNLFNIVILYSFCILEFFAENICLRQSSGRKILSWLFMAGNDIGLEIWKTYTLTNLLI